LSFDCPPRAFDDDRLRADLPERDREAFPAVRPLADDLDEAPLDRRLLDEPLLLADEAFLELFDDLPAVLLVEPDRELRVLVWAMHGLLTGFSPLLSGRSQGVPASPRANR
jgi:hypothetical protein